MSSEKLQEPASFCIFNLFKSALISLVLVLGCILINDKLITQECVFNYSFIMHISLLLKGKTTLKVMSTDKRKEFFNYTWSMEILYSPVIPVCIIRRSKEPF